MSGITEIAQRRDHIEKTSGRAEYIADYRLEGMLYAKILRSEKASAEIRGVALPPLPEGYLIVDANDIPPLSPEQVKNRLQPVFVQSEVCYIGDPVLLMAGPDKETVERLIAQVNIEYLEKTPVLTVESSAAPLAEYTFQKGDPRQALEQAAEIIDECYETGYQEHAYIEPQGMAAVYEYGRLTIYGAMQNPYYIKHEVAEYIGMDPEDIQVIQATTGGGFGGKEDFTSCMAAQAAAAARKAKKPVRLIFDRREDMSVTPKRHPSKIRYRAALDKQGHITAIEADICLNAGAYAVCTPVVLQRSMIVAANGYTIEHIRVRGRAMITNTVPTGAFRGFGAPQSVFSMELFMGHMAKRLGLTPLEIKKQYVARQNDATATNGRFHGVVKAGEMLERAGAISDFDRKYRLYEHQNGRYRKGIGLSVFLHGCGFTGSAEKDFLKSVARLAKHEDDAVEILVSSTEIGQGVKTTFSKIVSSILDIPLEQVVYEAPDTDRVPNSGPTVASRSIMIVGKLLERAALRMKNEWKPGICQIFEEHYLHPELIPWSLETFSGDAYPAYSWGVNVVEVEVDTLTALSSITDVYAIFDIGRPIDSLIARGQIEGGILQGIGFGSMEKMESEAGRLKQTSLTDYIIPTAKDIVPFKIEFIENLYENGPFGAKGLGELTLLGGAPAYAAAVENAVGKSFFKGPLTPERIMEAL